MKSFSLDLSKFKKVGGDKASTTLKHDDGHQLTINHSSLDQKKLSALNDLPLLSQENKLPPKRYAEAGTVEPTPEPSAPIPDVAKVDLDRAPQPEVEQAPPSDNSDTAATPQTDAAAATETPQTDAASSASQEAPPQAADTPAASPMPAPTPLESFALDKGAHMETVSKEDAAIAQDLAAQHIKPKSYADLFADKSTLGKIGSIFGLMLGGAGAGLTHTENPLIGMWKQQISNDLEAQKANVSNKQTLLDLNRKRFGDIESVTNFSRMQANRLALHSLTEQVQSLPLGSVERANAEKQLATIGQFVNTENYSLADQISSKQAFLNATTSSAGGDEGKFQSQQNMLRRSGKEGAMLADENEKHHVPGVPGQSSKPLTEDDRSTLQSKSLLDQKLQGFIDFAQKHSGSVDPKIIAVGKAKAAELNGLYRNATHGGVYKEGENAFINNLIDSNPTKFFNNLRGVIPKAQELMSSNQESLNSVKKNLGFPVQSAPTAQAAPQYKTVNGVRYMRGPNGEAIPVK